MEEKKPSISMIALFVALLLLTLAGAMFVGQLLIKKPAQPESITYNKYVFVKHDDLWITQWQHKKTVYELSLRYNPLEVEDIPITGTLNVSPFNERDIYITFDPNSLANYKYVALAGGELGLNLKRGLGREPIFTCTTNQTEAESCQDRPLATCDDTNLAVILLDGTGNTGIDFSGTCITLRGNDTELVRASDKLLYLWYGIMKRS